MIHAKTPQTLLLISLRHMNKITDKDVGIFYVRQGGNVCSYQFINKTYHHSMAENKQAYWSVNFFNVL